MTASKAVCSWKSSRAWAERAIEVPASTKLQTSTTCWRLPCELCSGETEPTSFCIHLDLFQRLSELVGVGWLFGTWHQTTGGVQNLPDGSAGTGERNLCNLQLWITRKIVEQGPRPGHPFQMFWRRKAHLHNTLDDTDIPAKVGRMMCPRVGTEHKGVMGITRCEPFAPFLDPTERTSDDLGQCSWRGRRGLLQQIVEQSSISHPFFFHGAFLLPTRNYML